MLLRYLGTHLLVPTACLHSPRRPREAGARHLGLRWRAFFTRDPVRSQRHAVCWDVSLPCDEQPSERNRSDRRGEEKFMAIPRQPDPAERNAILRFFYRDWHVTRVGRWVNRLMGWWSAIGLPPSFQAVLEVRGRKSGRKRSTPVAVATVEGKRYLVSMLGPESGWVKNVEAAHGDAFIRHGRRRHVHLVPVPPEERAPILREYVRIAPSGRQHFPLGVDAPLQAFEAIAGQYPAYRIEPA